MMKDKVQKGSTVSKHMMNKLMKLSKLYDAAYELFASNGVNDTSIDDIVNKAGVAKGTFYLYFDSKYDIKEKIILRKSAEILKGAFQATVNEQMDDMMNSIIFFTDYVIEYFKKNRKLLRLLHKELSWGFFSKALRDENDDFKEILSLVQSLKRQSSLDEKEFDINLFMIIELISSVCYSSIILEEPYTMDEMKPYLFNNIRNIIISSK